MRGVLRSNAPAEKSSTKAVASIARPLIAIGLTAYGVVALTVAWICELIIGSIQFCFAVLSVAFDALTVRKSPPAKPKPVEPVQFDRVELRRLAQVWDDWAANPRCTDRSQARDNAAYYRALLADLERPRIVDKLRGNATSPEHVVAPVRGLRANLRGIPAADVCPLSSPGLVNHEIEPTDLGVARRHSTTTASR